MSLQGARNARIPEVVIRRLPLYLRVVADLVERNVPIVSSAELARLTGFSSEQIRKDFACFGAFGTRGVGYRTDVLWRHIRSTLGLDRPVHAVLIGAGNLGTAFARYTILRDRDIRLVAIFDADRRKVGTEIEGVPIHHTEEMQDVIRRLGARMAIVAVPAEVAQQVVDQAVGAGVTAVLNFCPVKLRVPDHVHVQDVDLSLELQSLAYYVSTGPLS